MGKPEFSYREWLASVPDVLKNDPLWRMEVYRLALFIADLGWFDVTRLMRDRRTLKLAAQLYEALGSIGANIAEGYSRGSGRDRARFYEYALGSARESRNWYYNGRHVLGEEAANHRMAILTHIIRLLLTIIPRQRAGAVFEEQVSYTLSMPAETKTNGVLPDLDTLLQTIPMP